VAVLAQLMEQPMEQSMAHLTRMAQQMGMLKAFLIDVDGNAEGHLLSD
jgi:hypothetical protein